MPQSLPMRRTLPAFFAVLLVVAAFAPAIFKAGTPARTGRLPLASSRLTLRRYQGYYVLFISVPGHRSLHPNDEDLSLGTPALVVAST